MLDHGLYEQMPQELRTSLCQFWEAIVLKDRNKMQKYAKELNVQGELQIYGSEFGCKEIFE